MKVLLLNNYSMRAALEGVRRGVYPAHHLYGHPGAARVADRDGNSWRLPFLSIYDIIPFRGRFWRRVRGGIVRTLGDPLQQAHALLAGSRVDVVFAADQWSARGLLRLRRMGLFRVPIVVLVHHPPASKAQLRDLAGASQRVALGPAAARATTIDPANVTELLPWGPRIGGTVYADAVYPDGVRYDFVSAGRTNRDYEPLIQLAVEDRLSGVIYDGTYRWQITEGSLSRTRMNADYATVLKDMSAADVIVIPFARDDVMAGLTEVADAIALGKPILATQSCAFPYELEKFKAGATVENTVTDLRCGFQLLIATKANARNLAQKYNLANFEAALDRVLGGVAMASGKPEATS